MVYGTDGNTPHVFSAPWEARIFALVVSLHENGHLDWAEWTAMLSRVIAAHASSDTDRSGEGYAHWLEALERLFRAKEMSTDM